MHREETIKSLNTKNSRKQLRKQKFKLKKKTLLESIMIYEKNII
jgi:hypothetical protein